MAQATVPSAPVGVRAKRLINRGTGASRFAQECAQSVEYQFRSLLDDPVTDPVYRFELKIGEPI